MYRFFMKFFFMKSVILYDILIYFLDNDYKIKCDNDIIYLFERYYDNVSEI